MIFNRNVPQVQYNRSLLSNPLFNYAALSDEGRPARYLRHRGWQEVARFDQITVLRSEP